MWTDLYAAMMRVMGRIPSALEVASLSRDDWEDLCRLLVAIMHQAEGVEDRHGKGNGLDMIRIDPDGARGWQFRRFDDRFGDAQVADILKGVRLASTRCQNEDKVTLVEYVVWANLDLEPGHKGSKGERERFSDLATAVKQELGVKLRFVGLTSVRAELLMRPALCPRLFEDVPAQVAAVQQQLKELTDALKPLTDEAAKASGAVRRLVEQATVHFERGYAQGTSEFKAAWQCFSDALALLTGTDADRTLEGRVLLALAGTERMLGNLPQAEATARRAINALAGVDENALAQARGTLALILQDEQRFGDAEPLFKQVLEYFEAANNPIEHVRALTHLVEFNLNNGGLAEAEALGPRLKAAVLDLEQMMGGFSDVSVAGAGTLARVLLEAGQEHDSVQLLGAAERVFNDLESAGVQLESPHILVAALTGKAEAVRYQNRLDHAERLIRSAIAHADEAAMSKAVADGYYTLALVQEERQQIAAALESMVSAKKQYQAIKDTASEGDASRQLARLTLKK